MTFNCFCKTNVPCPRIFQTVPITSTITSFKNVAAYTSLGGDWFFVIWIIPILFSSPLPRVSLCVVQTKQDNAREGFLEGNFPHVQDVSLRKFPWLPVASFNSVPGFDKSSICCFFSFPGRRRAELCCAVPCGGTGFISVWRGCLFKRRVGLAVIQLGLGVIFQK